MFIINSYINLNAGKYCNKLLFIILIQRRLCQQPSLDLDAGLDVNVMKKGDTMEKTLVNANGIQ